MPYNCKLFIIKIVTWSYNCIQRIIIIIIIIIIVIIDTLWEFSTSANADGLLLKWQPVP